MVELLDSRGKCEQELPSFPHSTLEVLEEVWLLGTLLLEMSVSSYSSSQRTDAPHRVASRRKKSHYVHYEGDVLCIITSLGR